MLLTSIGKSLFEPETGCLGAFGGIIPHNLFTLKKHVYLDAYAEFVIVHVGTQLYYVTMRRERCSTAPGAAHEASIQLL